MCNVNYCFQSIPHSYSMIPYRSTFLIQLNSLTAVIVTWNRSKIWPTWMFFNLIICLWSAHTKTIQYINDEKKFSFFYSQDTKERYKNKDSISEITFTQSHIKNNLAVKKPHNQKHFHKKHFLLLVSQPTRYFRNKLHRTETFYSHMRVTNEEFFSSHANDDEKKK